MKNAPILLLALYVGLVYGQSNKVMEFTIDETYKRDSIRIENVVEFYSYSDAETAPIDAVRLKVKITNLGNLPIPNLKRVGNRSRCLKLFVNNKNTDDPNITNGLEGNDWPVKLEKNESDTFQTGFILKSDSGILTYENPMSIKWNYIGMDSPTVVVDALKKKPVDK